MKLQYLLVVLLFCLSSCNNSNKSHEYTPDTSDSLILKAKANQLSQEDYFEILFQLDGMFETVYTKAEQAQEKGVSVDSIRNFLASDAEYIKITQQAVVLDSVLSEYIKSPVAPRSLRNNYFQVSSQAAKRAHRVGLY